MSVAAARRRTRAINAILGALGASELAELEARAILAVTNRGGREGNPAWRFLCVSELHRIVEREKGADVEAVLRLWDESGETAAAPRVTPAADAWEQGRE